MGYISAKETSQPMGEPESNKLSLVNTVVWLFFIAIGCVYFALAYNVHPDYLNIVDYTKGLSPTPYQGRVLPMYVFRELIGRSVIIHIALKVPLEDRTPYQVAKLLMSVFALAGSVLATYGTLKRLTGNILYSRWASFLVLYMAYFTLVQGWGLAYTFPYDTLSLFFFCLGIYLTVVGELWAICLYYVAFPFAVLNRETAIFLTLIFLVWNWKKERRISPTLMLHGVVQVAIWVALKEYVGHMFVANRHEAVLGGGYLVNRLLINFKSVVSPQQWPILLSVGGFLLPVLFLWRRWIRNPGLEWCCAIVLPLWFVGMMLVGIIIEIRVFSETVALAAPALALAFYHRFYLPAKTIAA